jgi:DNA-binding SARP family transcriptional activator/predicted ATPase
MLTLAVLGHPEVRQNGQQVSFATRKVLALLLYLAVEGGRHSREKLTALFWPESDNEHGRAALRRVLVLLRQALPDADAYLRIEREHLGFNPEADFTLDLNLVDAAARTGPSRETLATLHAAAAAYRGGFLEGFSLDDAPDFDEWASLQREHWNRRVEIVLDRLTTLHAESGATGPAIDVAARWVAHAPLNEVAHRRLMQCLFAAGNRTSALQAYETCRTLLHEELGIEPSSETKALAERIRVETMPQQPIPRQLSPSPSIPEWPFVGRALEFHHLVEAYYAVAHGAARTVILEGEAGIGKTRLAAEFARWARAQGAQVLHGAALDAGDRLPYHPLANALRQTNLRASATRLSPVWRVELSQLFPELRENLPDAPATVAGDDPSARTRLLEALARLTQAFAERAPLVLVIDDAQWADGASLDVLRYIVRHWSAHATPALLLLTVRSESRPPRLKEWLASIEREAQTTRLALSALTTEETEQLVERMASNLATDESAAFSQWLFAETGGQPFFLVETLKALVERDLLSMHLTAHGKWKMEIPGTEQAAALRRLSFLPRGVQDLIRFRLARLTSQALAFLVAGAVLGRDFDFATACAVAGLEEGDGLAALDELRDRALAWERDGEQGQERLAIAHDKIREVVYGDASQARRHVFHRRALEALQVAATPSGALAHHALAAGATEPAFRFSLIAGEEAMGVFAVRSAIRHFELARSLLDALQVPLAQLESLYLQLGRAYELEADFANARAVYEALLVVTRREPHPEAECAALNRLATLAAQASLDFTAALVYLHEALVLAEQSGEASIMAETEWNLAQTYYYMLDARSLPHGEHALALARTPGRPDLLARCLNVVAWAKATFPGECNEALTYAEEARALYASLYNRVMEADCLCLLASAQHYLGQLQNGIANARAAQAISREIENPWGQAHSAFQLSKCLLDVGAYAETLALAQQAADLAQTREMPLLRMLCQAQQGAVKRLLGLFEEARADHLRMATSLAEDSASAKDYELMITLELLADSAYAGDWQGAWEQAQRLRAVPSLDRNPPYNLVLSFDLLIETLMRAGEMEAATDLVRSMEGYTRANRRTHLALLRAQAILARAQGEPTRAIAVLRQAAALADTMGLAGELWHVYAALGELRRAQGDEAQAQEANSRAAAIVRYLADQLDDERLRASFLAAEPARQLLAD